MNTDLQTIWKNLPDARLVGGCVRDKLLGIEPHDYDFCTIKTPNEVMNIFSTKGFQVIPTGLQHGTISVVVNGNVYEITTLRTDDITDGRHAAVSFTTSWETDAERRDFTFNALYMDSEGKIYDYHDGIADLNNRKIKFIGKAEDRIKEDSLRILRYYRFMTKIKNLKGDEKDIQDIINNKDLIKNLSVERVYSELEKIFDSNNKWNSIKLLNKHGISDIIFNKKIIIPKSTSININHLDIFSYMADKKDYMKQFKTSNDKNIYVNNVYNMYIVDDLTEYNIKKLLLDYSREEILSGIFKKKIHEDITETWEVLKEDIYEVKKPIFPLQGKDLIKMGLKQGKYIGEHLKHLKKYWINNNFITINYWQHIVSSIFINYPKTFGYKDLYNKQSLLLEYNDMEKLGIDIKRTYITIGDTSTTVSIRVEDGNLNVSGYYIFSLKENSILQNKKFRVFCEYYVKVTAIIEGVNYDYTCDNPKNSLFLEMNPLVDREEYEKYGYYFFQKNNPNINRCFFIVFEDKKDIAKVKLKI